MTSVAEAALMEIFTYGLKAAPFKRAIFCGCRRCTDAIESNGRGERIRTSDPLVPNQVLYQAEPLPELTVGWMIVGSGGHR